MTLREILKAFEEVLITLGTNPDDELLSAIQEHIDKLNVE